MQTIKARIAEKLVEQVKSIRAEAELDSAAVVSTQVYSVRKTSWGRGNRPLPQLPDRQSGVS